MAIDINNAYSHIITPDAAKLGQTLNGASMDELKGLMAKIPENTAGEANFRAQAELRNQVNLAKERIVGPVRLSLSRMRAGPDAALADLRARTEETIKRAQEIDTELIKYGPIPTIPVETVAVDRAVGLVNRFSRVPGIGMFIAPLTGAMASNPTGTFKALRTRAESAFYSVAGMMAPNNQVKAWAEMGANRMQAIAIVEGVIGTRPRAFDQKSVNPQQVAFFINGKPNWQSDLRTLTERALTATAALVGPAAVAATLTWPSIVGVEQAEKEAAAKVDTQFANLVKTKFGDKVADFKLDPAPGKATASRKAGPGNKFDITLSKEYAEAGTGNLKPEARKLLDLLGVIPAPTTINTVNVAAAGTPAIFERSGAGTILTMPIDNAKIPANRLTAIAESMHRLNIQVMRAGAGIRGAEPTIVLDPGSKTTLYWSPKLEDTNPALLETLPPAVETEGLNAEGKLPGWKWSAGTWVLERFDRRILS